MIICNQLGKKAFWGCSNLTELFLPEHLVDIGARAFMTGSIINGYPNSLAETYAKDNGFIFVDRTQTSSNEESGIIVQPEQGETVQKPGNISTLKPEDIKINSIGVSGLSHNIAAGKKIQLSVTVFPENASNKMVQWSSSNPAVATVTPSGIVTVKKKTGGKSVVIRATAMDGSGKTGLWKIVSMKGEVKSVVISGKKSAKAGGALKLKANVKSTKGAYKKINWNSSNTKWATVTSSGKVKTSKAAKGKAVKITAMAMDGSKKKNTVTIKIK